MVCGSIVLMAWGGGKRLALLIGVAALIVGATTMACGFLAPSMFWAVSYTHLDVYKRQADGKTNLSLADVEGEVLVVSQFTLYASCRKGNRPSFTAAGAPDEANRLYEWFAERARRDVARVETGRFGAYMDVSLVNDGPFTLWLDTDEL